MALLCRGEEKAIHRTLWQDFEDFVSSADGAWTVFLVADCALSYVRFCCPLSPKGILLVKRASRAITAVGLALSVPACLGSMSQTGRSVIGLARRLFFLDLKAAFPIPLLITAKKTALSVVELIYNLTYIPDLLQRLRSPIFNQAQSQSTWVVYYASSLILDGADLSKDLAEKRECYWLHVAKETSSIAFSVLSLSKAFLRIPAGWTGVFAVSLLNLNLLWLVLKIAAYFCSCRHSDTPSGLN